MSDSDASLRLPTERLVLQLESLEGTRARIAALPAEIRAEVSPAWLERLHNASGPSPWILSFCAVRYSDAAEVGTCGFKGPPSASGSVEIAYGVHPEFQNQGYATEMARALAAYAFRQNCRQVWAHTLPENSASTRVLEKSGFCLQGPIVDPDDGQVWRWTAERSDRSRGP